MAASSGGLAVHITLSSRWAADSDQAVRPVSAERIVDRYTTARVRSVNHPAVAGVYSHVTNVPPVCAEEEQIAGLDIVPSHPATAAVLLRGRARQADSLSLTVEVFREAGAVEASATGTAIAISSAAERESCADNAGATFSGMEEGRSGTGATCRGRYCAEDH